MALEFGKGRVAILTDTGVATALIGKNKARIGLNNLDCDNPRFARSLMDWLSDGSL